MDHRGLEVASSRGLSLASPSGQWEAGGCSLLLAQSLPWHASLQCLGYRSPCPVRVGTRCDSRVEGCWDPVLPPNAPTSRISCGVEVSWESRTPAPSAGKGFSRVERNS